MLRDVTVATGVVLECWKKNRKRVSFCYEYFAESIYYKFLLLLCVLISLKIGKCVLLLHIIKSRTDAEL